jgi:putative FmdB family regulatory protein
MPTYSYRCTECGEAFDIQQAFTDDTLTVCPNCGGKLRKLFTAVGVTFNGSGFYRNDSRPVAKSESSSASSTSSGSSGSSEKSSTPSPSAAKTESSSSTGTGAKP